MRELRRKDRELGKDDAIDLLKKGEYGILSTVDRDNNAYGVPMSYIYWNNAIYFHCALEGYKLDNIKNNASASFCVVGQTCVISEQFSTLYESVIVSGIAECISGDEKKGALLEILNKYSKENLESGKLHIERAIGRVEVIKINIDRIVGKARK